MMRRALGILLLCALGLPAAADNIKGRVLADGRPAEGVPVSDGEQIVLTDALGRYSMQSTKSEGSVFVITPSGYCAQSLDGMRPGFWQSLYLPVKQEESHDFSLCSEDQSTYSVIFTADMHLSNDPRRDDLRRFRDIVLPVIDSLASAAQGPVYTFNLGDTTHDVYWYEYDFTEADGMRFLQDVHYPTRMYTLMGNHDHDGSIVGDDVDHRAAWMERDCWGPGRYSLNVGGDHWLFLDNIRYINVKGKGKKAPGIKGDRSYDIMLTEAQMAWVEKDLALLSPDTRVYICTHAPMLATKQEDGLAMPQEQMEWLAALCSRFTYDVNIYSGHIHKFDICDHPDFPRLHQYSLPATSGIMWETRLDWPLTSSDGGDAGIWHGTFGSGRNECRYQSYSFGESLYRIYDMNEIGRIYKATPGIAIQQQLFAKTRLDYSRKEWKNWIFVNYWSWKPGDTVEMLENGKPLKVLHEPYEDPVKNLSYDVPMLEAPVQHHANRASDSCIHMYEAKTRSAKSNITLRIRNARGEVIAEQTIKRPYPLDSHFKTTSQQ